MHYIYVCHFSNGHIKVGRSTNPKSRIAAHEDRVACLGVELIEYHLAECIGHAAPAEVALIERCADVATKRNRSEWFVGLDYLDVCKWAGELASVEYKCKTKTKQKVSDAFANWIDAKPGRATALANHFNRTPSAITQWRTNGVPVHHMKAVRDFTGGEVTLEEMIPDVNWGVLRNQHAEAAHV